MIVARPPATEYSHEHKVYVSRTSVDVEPISALETQRDEVLRLLVSMSEERSAYRYAPGKWSIKQVVGHMADAERVFAYRLLRFARGDATPVPGFDQDVFIAGAIFDELSYADLVSDWATVRAASITLVRTVSPGAWMRLGTASERPCSARALLYVILGHTEHHRSILTERYSLAPSGD